MSDLKPDEVRQMLRECVTVVAPGEILVLNFPHLDNATFQRVRELVRAFNIDHGTDLKVLVVSGGVELGVVPDRAANAPD